MTAQNLAEVMSFLDRAQLERSKLLEKARTPHATMRTPAIGTHEFHIYESILDWARIAIDDADQNTVAPVAKPKGNSFTPASQMLEAHRAKASLGTDDQVGADFEKRITLIDPSAGEDQSVTPENVVASENTEKPVSDSHGDSSPTSKQQTPASDPFDPAVFNQRHGKHR